MARVGGGWFEQVVPEAGAGTRYRYRLADGLAVPDPASRFQPDGVHGASEVIDPRGFDWPDSDWRGRPWHETVLYELHVGAFGGDFAGVEARLDHLASLGVTAVELMPLSAFPGARGWGYDGVAPFAPFAGYGRPEALKSLVAAAHARGLMVFLDVVYNHFGPEGCYLHAYAPQFFTDRHRTPWGAAIDLDGPRSAEVRRFLVHNALFWLEEYRLDGLRLDAVHALHDASDSDFLEELARAVQAGPGRERHVHLVLENDDNEALRLSGGVEAPGRYRAQWNDDLHHALHVLLTGEDDGYYADYAHAPVEHLGRSLAEGFAYQGEASRHRGGVGRGEPSAHLPAGAFVGFLQNHDQVGNRARGERITALAPEPAVRAASALVLLSPQVPMLFMGEELGADQPFPFFCDFGPELAGAVTEGRRREFARFADASARGRIPDPNDPTTFASACLDWSCLDGPTGLPHRRWLEHYRTLIACRRRHLVPRLAGDDARGESFEVNAAGVLVVRWRLGDGARLLALANLSPHTVTGAVVLPPGEVLFVTPVDLIARADAGTLPAWSAAFVLQPSRAPSR
jgi:malto-oligosyltrehalose trehalohydrolase